MKITQTGTLKKDPLDKLVPIKPIESFQQILLERLDYLIGFMTKEKFEFVEAYVNDLTKKFQKLGEVDYLEASFGKIEDLTTKFNNLNQYPDLNKASLNYLIHLLQLKESKSWKTEVKISMKALIQAWMYPFYYILETLAETITRKDAISLFKRYITHYYIDHPSPNRDKFGTLEKRLESKLSGDTTSSEWVIDHAIVEEGKYAFKNYNCPTCADVLVDFPDTEFKYLASCYGDYAKFRANLSEHIILTMEHTIIKGDPYCSRVVHDTRVDYNLHHPPKKFWDNFKPGNEKEALKYYK